MIKVIFINFITLLTLLTFLLSGCSANKNDESLHKTQSHETASAVQNNRPQPKDSAAPCDDPSKKEINPVVEEKNEEVLPSLAPEQSGGCSVK